MPNTHRVLNTSDLTFLIFGHLDISNLARVMTVSRDFFNSIVPQVWKRVPGTRPLTDLVPDIGPDIERHFECMALECPSSISQLSRFNFYAPFVKEINISVLYPNQESNWKLLKTLVPHRPLLPKLHTLIFYMGDDHEWPQGYDFGSTDSIIKANVFIAPSLTDIRLPHDCRLWPSPADASILLARIAETALELQTLHLFARDGTEDLDSAAFAYIGINRFQHLRVLACSQVAVTAETLRLLGSLPQLESLVIRASPMEDAEDDMNAVPDSTWELPVHSFPRLKHLAVYSLPLRLIVQIWCIPSLVSRLVSISVKFQPGCWARRPLLTQTILTIICKATPQTQELSIDFDELDLGADLTSSVLEHLRQHSLLRFSLKNVADIELMSSVAFLSFSRDIEFLDMHGICMASDELMLIAKNLPKLQFLGCNLVLNYVDKHLKSKAVVPSPSMLCLVADFAFSAEFAGDFSEMDVDWDVAMTDYIEAIARSLLTLWPRGVHCEAADHPSHARTEWDDELLYSLNYELAILSESNGSELPSGQSCRASWVYSPQA